MQRLVFVLIALAVVALGGCGDSASDHAEVPTARNEQVVKQQAKRRETQRGREVAELEQEVARRKAREAREEPAPPQPGEVTRSEFGEDWPLTVASGTIRCDGSPGAGQVIFTAPTSGTEYALNGTALEGGYASIDPIWRYEPGMAKYELRVNIGVLTDRGLALCD
jgi:hypothetical protein